MGGEEARGGLHPGEGVLFIEAGAGGALLYDIPGSDRRDPDSHSCSFRYI